MLHVWKSVKQRIKNYINGNDSVILVYGSCKHKRTAAVKEWRASLVSRVISLKTQIRSRILKKPADKRDSHQWLWLSNNSTLPWHYICLYQSCSGLPSGDRNVKVSFPGILESRASCPSQGDKTKKHRSPAVSTMLYIYNSPRLRGHTSSLVQPIGFWSHIMCVVKGFQLTVV